MKILQTSIILLFLALSVMAKKNIALLELTGSGVETADLRALTEKLSYELHATDSFNVLERSEMATILKEQEFQQTGCTDASCAVEVGQLLNVDEMVVGSVNKLGNLYTIMIRSMNVGTGEVARSASVDCYDYQIEDLMLTAMKHVSLLFAGLDKETVNKLAPLKSVKSLKKDDSDDGFTTINYKGEKKGYGKAEFLLETKGASLKFKDSLYERGIRGVRITGIPEGKYPYSVTKKWQRDTDGKISIADDKVSKKSITLKDLKKHWFTVDVGFVNISANSISDNEYLFSYLDSITYQNLSFEGNYGTFAPSLAIGWESRRMRFEFGGILDVNWFKDQTIELKNINTNEIVSGTTSGGWLEWWYAMGWKIPLYRYKKFVVGAEPGLRLSFRMFQKRVNSPQAKLDHETGTFFGGGTLGYVNLYLGIEKVQLRGGYSIGGGIEEYRNDENYQHENKFVLNHTMSLSLHFAM